MNLTNRLKPQHMRLVAKIAETGKLQIAAEALAMSQPAASRILLMVETEAGGALFIRTPSGMQPTEHGHAFLRHAKVILSQYETLETEMSSLNDGFSGNIRVGSVTGPAVESLVPAVQALRKDSPGLNISIEVGPSTQLVRGLEEGFFDFIIARVPPDHDASELQIHPARFEMVSFVVRRQHPLADGKNVSLSDITPLEWIMQEPGSPIRDAVENACYTQGLPIPHNVTNSSSLLIALTMLSSSDVVAPISEQVANLICFNSLDAKFTKLDMDTSIQVRPYFVIRNRYKQLTRATNRLLSETLQRL